MASFFGPENGIFYPIFHITKNFLCATVLLFVCFLKNYFEIQYYLPYLRASKMKLITFKKQKNESKSKHKKQLQKLEWSMARSKRNCRNKGYLHS